MLALERVCTSPQSRTITLAAMGDFAAARGQVRGDFVIMPRVALKSDDPVMLDGMRLEDLQRQFEVPLFAFDFAGLAEMLESVSSERIPAREPQAEAIGA